MGDSSEPPIAQFRLRIRKGPHVAIGPGKIALLEAIGRTGSISAAARSLGMSYRRAWLLIDEMNACMRRPAVATATGGVRGGGSRLTPEGVDVIARYRAIEKRAHSAVASELDALLRHLA